MLHKNILFSTTIFLLNKVLVIFFIKLYFLSYNLNFLYITLFLTIMSSQNIKILVIFSYQTNLGMKASNIKFYI